MSGRGAPRGREWRGPLPRGAHADSPRNARSDDTRARLLDAGIRLFSAHGFNKVTVRDLCREADANLAAIGYHFGDKLSLYLAVVQMAIDTMRALTDAAINPPEGASAEARLRHYVHAYLPRLVKRDGRASWMPRLIDHEIAEPTPAAKVIAEQAIHPRLEYLKALIGELLDLPPSDPRVGMCVMSVQSQCLFYRPNRFHEVVAPGMSPRTDAEIAKVAEHIAEFSLAAIRALKKR